MFWKKKNLPFPEDQMRDLERHAFAVSDVEAKPDVIRILDELGRADGADYRIAGFVEKAIRTARAFAQQRKDFEEVLAHKFRSTEITYQRYEQAVTRGGEIVEKNLAKLPYVIRSAIQTDSVRERKLIEKLLLENESLLRATAELTAELSILDTDTTSGKAELACKQLEELRERAHLYSSSNN